MLNRLVVVAATALLTTAAVAHERCSLQITGDNEFSIHCPELFPAADSQEARAEIVDGRAYIPKIGFYRPLGGRSELEWLIDNVEVNLFVADQRYFAKVRYWTNAHEGAGSHDENTFLVTLRDQEGRPLQHLGPTEWAAWCVPRNQRNRSYGPFTYEITEATFRAATMISVPALRSGSHPC